MDKAFIIYLVTNELLKCHNFLYFILIPLSILLLSFYFTLFDVYSVFYQFILSHSPPVFASTFILLLHLDKR